MIFMMMYILKKKNHLHHLHHLRVNLVVKRKVDVVEGKQIEEEDNSLIITLISIMTNFTTFKTCDILC